MDKVRMKKAVKPAVGQVIKGTKSIVRDAQVREESFASGFNFYKQVYIVLIGSFLGYVYETVWYLVKYGEFVDRKGVFFGPYSPIYGVGMWGIALLLQKVHNRNPFYIIGVSALLGAAFEIVCSILQEIIFGWRSWDYSGTFLSIGGRTNFLMACMWGLVGYVFVVWLYPFLTKLIEGIPNKIGRPLCVVLLILFCLDIFITSAAVLRNKYRERGIPAENRFEELLDQHYPDEYIDAFLQT